MIRDEIYSKECLNVTKETCMNLSSFSMKVLAASLVLVSTTGLAFAKNYKGEANYKGESMAVPCPAPRVLMNGWYLGGQAGYDSFRIRESSTVGVLATSTAIAANGWMGGLFLGYGAYLNEWFYLAGELNGNYSGAQQTTSFVDGATSLNLKTQARGSWALSVLPGYRLNDTSLGYVRLGWNWTNFKNTATFTGVGSASANKTLNGFVFGVGIETLIVDNWSVRTEVDHFYYSSNNGSGSGLSASFSPSDTQGTLGVIYHFG
jgi:opacity protein-like surface antigen